jgi:FkbM family methyltransferase
MAVSWEPAQWLRKVIPQEVSWRAFRRRHYTVQARLLMTRRVSLKSRARRFLDLRTPRLAAAWRWTRDNFDYVTAKPYQTSFGATLLGPQDLDAERLASNETAQFVKCLSDVDAVVDVGAHIGYFTLLAAAHQKSVFAIEPNRLNLRLLLRNLMSNDGKGVEVFATALGYETGVKALFGGGQGASLDREWAKTRANYHTLVPVNTLSNLLGERLAGKRLLIKIDAEGYENQIVRGGTTFLDAKPRPIWIVEHAFPESQSSRAMAAFVELFEMFWTRGYDVLSISDEERLVSRFDVNDWMEHGHPSFGWAYYMFRETGSRIDV